MPEQRTSLLYKKRAFSKQDARFLYRKQCRIYFNKKLFKYIDILLLILYNKINKALIINYCKQTIDKREG